jgi:hypothetical protein
MLVISQGLQFLGKHFLLIIVAVDPESSNTFSKILDLTEEMVSTNMIVTGVRLVETVFVVLSTDHVQAWHNQKFCTIPGKQVCPGGERLPITQFT